MPELPEVEAARRAIDEHCIGKKIKKSVIADDPKVIDGVAPRDFEASLAGKTIVAAHRKGKNMWIELDSPPFPSFQFGMAGAIYIKGVAVTKYKRSAVKDSDEWPSKYSKVFIELDDGLEVSFTDKRRFAKVRLLENPPSVPPISELGLDALLEPMTIDEFYNSVSKKKIGIKALLLEQSFISGIGNWIADEVLYQARIHPLQIASSMSKESCETLLKCIKEVVQFAVEVDADCSRFPLEWLFHFRWGKKAGKVNGKILGYIYDVIINKIIQFLQVIEKAVEVGADSSEFPRDWIFHSREKKPDRAFVDGKKIEFMTAGGRTTAFVPELQKLSGSQVAKAPAKKGNETRKKNKNVDESESEDDEDAKSVKLKKGRKTPAKGKSNKDGDDDEESDDDKKKKKKKGAAKVKKEDGGAVKKKPPVRKRSKGSDSGDEEVMKSKEAKAGRISKRRAGSGENRKQTKKRAE